jgi:hypothetical protein
MGYKILAGAPFDKNNLFTTSGLDAGPIKVLYESAIVQSMDGGDFTQGLPTEILHDGGEIPLAGTASYYPSKIYGPEDIVTVFYDN